MRKAKSLKRNDEACRGILIAPSPETPTFLSCSGLDNLKSQLCSFPFEMVDLSLAVLGLVELGSLVHVLHAVAQHTVDQSGQLGRHGLNRHRGAKLGSQSAELRSDIGAA